MSAREPLSSSLAGVDLVGLEEFGVVGGLREIDASSSEDKGAQALRLVEDLGDFWLFR